MRELPIKSAIRLGTGEIVEGDPHIEAFAKAALAGKLPMVTPDEWQRYDDEQGDLNWFAIELFAEPGFITNKGTFVGRMEAMDMFSSDEQHGTMDGELHAGEMTVLLNRATEIAHHG